MEQPDLSVVVAIHREATLLRRTLLSLATAISFASDVGYLVQTVFVLDRTDEPTRSALDTCDLPEFQRRRVVCLDAGSPGLARNAGMDQANGRLLAIADADDLVAPNFLALTIREADQWGPDALVVPQWLIAFGVTPHVAEFLPLSQLGCRALFGGHPFVHRICGHRATLQARRYACTDREKGEGFEDWHFNAEAVADGLDIRPAPGAVMFYRTKRDGRMANDLHAKADVPACRLFTPRVYSDLSSVATGTAFNPQATRKRLLDAEGLEDALLLANAIDPEVQPAIVRTAPIFDNRAWLRPHLDAAYSDVVSALGGDDFAEVFILPFISTGGADRYVEDIMRVMYKICAGRRILVLLGERLAARSDITRVPPNATVLDLSDDFPGLSPQERDLLTLRLIRTVAPRARIHLRPSPYADQFMAAYGSAIAQQEIVYYRFGEPAGVSKGTLHALPYGFHFVAEHLPRLSRLVADNPRVIANDRRRLGIWPHKWQLLRSRHSPAVTDEAVSEMTARNNGRVLWASRPDSEKRPELLPFIARALKKIVPTAHIDAYGNSVLGGFDPRSLSGLASLTFHGPHAGFATLRHARYDCFVYTSWFDGLPVVLLEAAAHGLPIIAPDVGGVGDFVADGETGILLPSLSDDRAMARSYAAAIAELLSDPGLRKHLALGALRRLREYHAESAYEAEVARIYQLGAVQ